MLSFSPSLPPAHRPLSTQNCWTDVCGVHWRVSLWTVCTATCGNYGFQSRRVDCVHIRTNRPVMEHHCSWRPRPANWQRCNITPCENGTSLRGGEAEWCRGRKKGRVVSQKHSTGSCSWASWGTSSPDLCKIQPLKLSVPERNTAHSRGFWQWCHQLGLCPLSNSMRNNSCSLLEQAQSRPPS